MSRKYIRAILLWFAFVAMGGIVIWASGLSFPGGGSGMILAFTFFIASVAAGLSMI